MYVISIGVDPGFSEEGSKYRGGSLKQGVQPPRNYRVLKSCIMQRCLSKYKELSNQISVYME